MKKTFKFASAAALGMLVFASCSTDDLGFAGQDVKQHKGRQLIIEMDEPVSDEPVTRSLMAQGGIFNNTPIWEEGDVIRGYDELLHVYDNYVFDESSEKFYEESLKPDLSYEETKYTFFGDVSYGGWKKGVGLTALTKIDTVFTYSEADVKSEAYTGKAYAGNLPMFGKVTSFEEGALKSKLVFLTGALKVTLQNGSKTVKAIKVYSLTENDEPNVDMPLSGYFDAVLDSEDETFSANVNTSHLQKSEEAVLQDSYKNVITVSTENLPEFTSIVYVPIIPSAKDMTDETAYPKLKVVWVDADDEENEITTFENKVIRAHNFYASGQDGNKMEVSVKIQVEASNFARLQQIINEYAAKGLAVDIEDTLEITATKDDHMLTIPANAPAMKVNLAKGLVNKSGTEIVIKGGKEAGEFTLNASSYDNGSKYIDLSDYEGDFNVAGFNAKAVQGQKKNGAILTIGNLTNVHANGGNIVAKGKVTGYMKNHGTGTIEVMEGATVNELENEAEGGNITVAGTVTSLTSAHGDIYVTGGNVDNLVNNGEGAITVDGGVVNKLTNGEKGGKITAKMTSNASSWTDNSTADIEVEGLQLYNLTTKAANVTLKGSADKAMTTNGTLTLAGETVNVNVEDYCVNNIVCMGKAQYSSKGFSSVNGTVKEGDDLYAEVEGEHKLTFKSEWNGKITTSANINNKTVGTTYNVYTAAELAALLEERNGVKTVSTVNLYATIDLGVNNMWPGIYFATQGGTTFNGNDFTISNVNIGNNAESEENSQAFYGFGFIRRALYDITVKDLTLNKVNSDKLALRDSYITDQSQLAGYKGQVSGIGALVGRQCESGTYTNVKVVATTLGYDDEVAAFDGVNTKNCKVGGLVGMTMKQGSTNGVLKTAITKCNVKAEKIVGQWALGGLIGCVDAVDMSIALENNNVEVGEFATTLHIADKDEEDELNPHYGQIGMLIGCITDSERGEIATPLSIKQESGYMIKDCIVNKRADLGFIKNARTVKDEYEVFNGYEINKSVYVGYSWSNNTGNVTLNIDGWTAPTEESLTVNDLNVFIPKKRNDNKNYARKH